MQKDLREFYLEQAKLLAGIIAEGIRRRGTARRSGRSRGLRDLRYDPGLHRAPRSRPEQWRGEMLRRSSI